MAENPLLPHAELRALYQLLSRAVDPSLLGSLAPFPGKRGQKILPLQERAAVLAGTLMQLRTGDVALALPGDNAVSTLLTEMKGRFVAAPSFGEGAPRMHLAAGLAAGLRRAESKGAVLVFLQSATPEPQWQDGLAWAQNERLPVVFAVADPSGPELFRSGSQADAGVIAWPAVHKTTSRLQLPVLSVDGEDAVAVYRVMQESLLRARSGGGPAMLWAALPSTRPRKPRNGAAPPALGRLETFMGSRQIRFS